MRWGLRVLLIVFVFGLLSSCSGLEKIVVASGTVNVPEGTLAWSFADRGSNRMSVDKINLKGITIGRGNDCIGLQPLTQIGCGSVGDFTISVDWVNNEYKVKITGNPLMGTIKVAESTISWEANHGFLQITQIDPTGKVVGHGEECVSPSVACKNAWGIQINIGVDDYVDIIYR